MMLEGILETEKLFNCVAAFTFSSIHIYEKILCIFLCRFFDLGICCVIFTLVKKSPQKYEKKKNLH